MKKLITICAALIMATAASAQQKIGHLNSVDIIQALPEYKQMSDAVEKKKQEYGTMMQTMYAEYDKKTKELQAGQGTMTELMQNTKMQELQDLEKRMTSFQEKAQTDLQDYAQKLAAPLQDKYIKGVKAVAKEQGYDYVFDLAANGVVYYPEGGTDLTQAVKTKIGANAAPPAPMGAPKPAGTPAAAPKK
ncbi:MAG: OmpH family outer membrane protein [Bacteroidetes bacterium]|nr:OmpH family outer membrane protein [Bacteroidota bacterium]